ncbi:MAG: hypothetical protein ACEQSK_15235 [Sphingomonadaceae bacterium]
MPKVIPRIVPITIPFDVVNAEIPNVMIMHPIAVPITTAEVASTIIGKKIFIAIHVKKIIRALVEFID